MKLRFNKSEADPNHCLKAMDDRHPIPAPSEDELFQTGVDLSLAEVRGSWISDVEW